MVVDDDDDYCFLTKKILQRAGAGKEIVTASNGLEALKKLQEISASGEKMPAFIFLDLKMPIMDGFEFLEEAAKPGGPDLSQTKVYLTTSSVLPKDRERAVNSPIAGFLIKPLTQHVLKGILTST